MRLQFQFLKDSLWFQVEEDLEFVDPSQGVQGLSLHDVGSRPLVGVPEVKECEGKRQEWLDYGFSLEWEALEGGTICSQLCLEVHVV